MYRQSPIDLQHFFMQEMMKTQSTSMENMALFNLHDPQLNLRIQNSLPYLHNVMALPIRQPQQSQMKWNNPNYQFQNLLHPQNMMIPDWTQSHFSNFNYQSLPIQMKLQTQQTPSQMLTPIKSQNIQKQNQTPQTLKKQSVIITIDDSQELVSTCHSEKAQDSLSEKVSVLKVAQKEKILTSEKNYVQNKEKKALKKLNQLCETKVLEKEAPKIYPRLRISDKDIQADLADLRKLIEKPNKINLRRKLQRVTI